MEKRTVLAVVLSSLVLLIWSVLMPKAPNPVSSLPTTTSVPQPVLSQSTFLVEENKASQNTPIISFSTDKCEILFDENKAAIKDVIFKEYQSSKLTLLHGLMLNNDWIFKKYQVSPDVVTFRHVDTEKEIIKRFSFSNIQYYIELDIDIQNVSSKAINIKLPVVLGVLDAGIDPNQARFQDVTVSTPEKILRLNGKKEQVFNQLKFIGLRDRYFCSILEPPAEKYIGYVKKYEGKKFILGIESSEFIIAPGQKLQQKLYIYIGPQQVKLISEAKFAWAAVVNYGTFDIVSQVLLQLLDFIHKYIKNWGWAIIILSVLIYFILYPLSLKQMRSMKEMQVLQPRIEELRKNYKDNPQKLNKEIMELYKEHKVNPVGGCLPLLLQMPIFFALYQALMRSIVLKGAKFLWIKDLSEPDRIGQLPFSLPMLGNEINLLPILMMFGTFIQQKLSMSTTTGVSSEQQKIMLILMPLMFGVIFYHMPAGLSLYWFVNSVLMIVVQMKNLKAK